jgi:hypothetical protein
MHVILVHVVWVFGRDVPKLSVAMRKSSQVAIKKSPLVAK